MLTIGIDLGSTTVKYALLSESGVLLSHDYVRHGSAVKQLAASPAGVRSEAKLLFSADR